MLRNSSKVYARGFSLIEVLISILILSFGVLAMGGLQLATLKSNQIAGNASLAATLAKDYTEMMRSNWIESSATSNAYLFDSDDITKSSTYCTTVGTTTTIATMHVADWAQRVNCQLPSGRAEVCRDPGPRNADGSYEWGCGGSPTATVSIKIGWIDKRESIERGTTTVSVTPMKPQLVISGVTGYAE